MASDTYSVPGANTWQVPAGVSSATIEVWGAGGGGGGSNNNATAGGAGGAGGGAYAVISISGLVSGNIHALYVGTAGAGGVANANGTAGEASYFNNNASGNTSTVISANGGGLGIHGANTGNKAGLGGAANASGGGITSYKGGNGANNGGTNLGGGAGAAAGNQNAGADTAVQTGGTGTNGGGSGGNGGARNANGNNYQTAPGAGGGGGGRANATTGSNRVGGTGANGYVVITYTTATLPTMSTEPASSVAEETATGNGTCTDTGGANLSARGFVYDTQSRSLPGNVAPASSGYASYTTESGNFGAVSYTASLTSLAPNQAYYIRSWGQNTAGYAYGDEETFTTVNWAVRLKDSSYVTDATATTRQISYPAGKGSGDFEAGKFIDTTNPASSFDPGSAKFSEWEICIEATAIAQTNDQIEIRLSNAGTALDTYTETPLWTIGTAGGPSLQGQLPLVGVGA